MAVAFLGLVPAELAGATTALRLSPPVVELQLPPGGWRRFSIRVSNDGPDVLPVSVSTAGVTLDSDGSPKLAPADDDWSCAGWIELDKTSLELGPAASDDVSAQVKVPRGVRGGRYAVVLFRTEMQGERRPGLQLRITAATATVVMLRVGRTGLGRGEVTGFGVGLSQEGDPQFTAAFENTGDIHVRLQGSVTVRDQGGRVVARLPLEVGTGTVLPCGRRHVLAVWDRWERCPDGEYVAELYTSFRGARSARRFLRFALSRGP
jgi:hypothetical protein